MCDPFLGCWPDLASPLALDEVEQRLRELQPGSELPQDIKLQSLVVTGFVADELAARRRHHLARIAWFVTNGFRKPIEVDVGVPALGCVVPHLVVDGNHRLAAAIFYLERREVDLWLPLVVSGDIALAAQLGLYYRTPRSPAPSLDC